MSATELYHNQVPLPLRLLRCWGIQDNWTSFRFSWGEINTKHLGFALGYSVYHEEAHLHVRLLWPNIFIKVPMLINQRPGTEDWNAHYGFSVFARDMHLNWRTRCKIVYFPWDWSHVRHDVFDKDGKRRTWMPNWGDPPRDDGRYTETHPYTYVLRSGVVQNRTATIYGEEMEWRWRWFRWLPWPRKIRCSISITFDDEVGERTGSWKGGCIGCSYEWLPGETMVQSLRRMEAERTF